MLRRWVAGSLMVLAMSVALWGETLPEISEAKELMAKVDENLNPTDEIIVSSFLLIHPNGQQKRWRIRTYYQRAPENGMGAVLLRFLDPADLKGITLVSVNQPEGENFQWLYLPAFRNPKLLTESNKSDYVFGSDLTFEDYVPFVLDDYSFERVRDETMEGRRAMVIRMVPVAEKLLARATYDHQLLWVDLDRGVLLRADSFDSLGRLFKTSTWSDFHQPDGWHWRAKRRTVFSPLRPHWTEVSVEEVRINEGLPSNFFSEESVTSLR